MAKGCALLIVIFVAIVTSCGIASIATRLADYGEAREQTRQVQIVADAAVEIEAIRADATKKTSLAFALFYLARAITWAAGLVWFAVAVALVRKWTVNYGA